MNRPSLAETEAALLDAVGRDPHATQRSLAEGLGIALGRANQLLRELEARGLLRVEPQDGRKVRYALTEAGRAALADASADRAARSWREYRRHAEAIRARLAAALGAGGRVAVAAPEALHELIREAARGLEAEDIAIEADPRAALERGDAVLSALPTGDPRVRPLFGEEGEPGAGGPKPAGAGGRDAR